MYAENFGFRKLPFENVPDPAFFFNQGDYARVLNGITESLKKGMGLMVVTGPEVSDIEVDNFLKQGAALPSSEWVTSDMKGPKSFIPLNAVDTKPAEEIRSIEKFNEWVAMDEKKPAVFRKPDGNKWKDEEEWELYTSFDRVAAGSKGTGSFKPSDSKGLRPSGRTKARVKSDEWVRAGRKNYWINRNIYYGKDIVRHE